MPKRPGAPACPDTVAAMKNFLAGSRILGTGFAVIARSPGLLLLGALPALLSVVLLVGALGGLLYLASDITTWLTPFATTWSPMWRDAVRVVVGLAIVAAAALLASVTFIALTLAIGGPFYEYIAEQAERRLGLDTSDDGSGWFRMLGRGIAGSLQLIVMSIVGAGLLFVLGFVPVLGQTVVPVLGAVFGAWIVSLEMVGMVFQRRGLTMRDRRRALGHQRATALGFGLPAYLLCLVPILQLVVIPAAVVGGTLLAHRLLSSESESAHISGNVTSSQ